MALCLVPASVFADGSRNIMLWIALFVISDCALTGAGYDPNVGFYKRKIVLAAGDGAVIGFARRLGFCMLFCVCRISFQHIGKLPKTSFKIHTVFVVGTAGCRTFYAADRSCTAISADSLRVLPDSRAAVRALAKTSPVP